MPKYKATSLDEQALKRIESQRVFNSPTYGPLTFKEVIYKIGLFMKSDPTAVYKVIIGTDSQVYADSVAFVSAIIIHRDGGGAIYFWHKTIDTTNYWVLKTRMFEEASLSMQLTTEFMDEYKTEGIMRYNTEIHVDVGTNGKTKEVISEVVAMIEGSGFAVKTKPQAFGAASVADRHT